MILFNLIAAVLSVLICRQTVFEFSLHLWSYIPEATGEARLFFGLWRVPVFARFILDKYGGAIMVLRIVGKTRRRPLRKSEKGVKVPLDLLTLDHASIDGCVGVKDDAFSAFMLAGILNAQLLSAAVFLANGSVRADVRPVYDRDTFWINVEGIASVRNAKIICAVLRGNLIRRNKKDGASHRKHNKEQHGADTRYG